MDKFRILIKLFYIVGLVMLLVAPAQAKRLALVIGIDAYSQLPSLKKAVNDARGISDTLKQIGFEVFLGENLNRQQMNIKIAELENKISHGDQVFFFFAGHGVAIGATNYLIPSDMPLPAAGAEGLVKGEAFAVDNIVDRIQLKGAKESVLVLDACRNNPFQTRGVRSIGAKRGLRDISAPQGVFVLFSAGIGQEALDRLSDNDPNPNSIFTRKLIPLMTVPGQSHVELAKLLQIQVNNLAQTVKHDQQPAYYDQIIGDAFLKPLVIADPCNTWPHIKNTNDANVVRRFLRNCSSGNNAREARIRLSEILHNVGTQWTLNIYNDLDFYEGDINQVGFSADSREDCESLCEGESECRLFSYVPSRSNDTENRCYLKKELGIPYVKKGIESGFYKKNLPGGIPAQVNVQVEYDLRFNKLVTFPTADRNWAIVGNVTNCSRECTNRNSCKAFTKYKLPFHDKDYNCELPRIFADTFLGTRQYKNAVTGVPDRKLLTPSHMIQKTFLTQKKELPGD